jgi:hypothetical protein
MKRLIYTVVFAVFISGLLFTCGDPEPEESCDANDLADDFCSQLDIDLVATFCSDGESNSYYTYNGDKYTCDGVAASTCTDALAAITAKMRTDEPTCFAKSTPENYTAAKTKLSKTAEKLLRNVRLNSMDKGF